uniref:Sterile alpha motif domain containing 13 n=1 Tax=Sus scrofa TaxID=9823 RepID=A0A8D0PNV1_PIG
SHPLFPGGFSSCKRPPLHAQGPFPASQLPNGPSPPTPSWPAETTSPGVPCAPGRLHWGWARGCCRAPRGGEPPGAGHAGSSVENGRPPDPADWAVMDVVNYFRTAGFEEQANAFQEQEIDGKSLLLMTRNDVLTGLQLKLGPALKIYEYHVKPLQTKHLKNNSS